MNQPQGLQRNEAPFSGESRMWDLKMPLGPETGLGSWTEEAEPHFERAKWV